MPQLTPTALSPTYIWHTLTAHRYCHVHLFYIAHSEMGLGPCLEAAGRSSGRRSTYGSEPKIRICLKKWNHQRTGKKDQRALYPWATGVFPDLWLKDYATNLWLSAILPGSCGNHDVRKKHQSIQRKPTERLASVVILLINRCWCHLNLCRLYQLYSQCPWGQSLRLLQNCNNVTCLLRLLQSFFKPFYSIFVVVWLFIW